MDSPHPKPSYAHDDAFAMHLAAIAKIFKHMLQRWPLPNATEWPLPNPIKATTTNMPLAYNNINTDIDTSTSSPLTSKITPLNYCVHLYALFNKCEWMQKHWPLPAEPMRPIPSQPIITIP